MLLSDEVQPIWVINRYIWKELSAKYPELEDHWPDPTIIPFFPVNDSTSGNTKWDGKPYFIYNSAFRVEHSMYAHKKTTFVYSLRASTDEIFALSTALQHIIDRQDDAAQDVNDFNNWLKENKPGLYCPVTFDSFTLYQNEPGNARDSSSVPYVTAQFMLVARYHWL